MKRLEKISVLTAKLKKAVAEEGIGGLAGRTKGYLARAKKEKEFQREKSRVYRDILFISGCRIHTGTAWCIRWSSWRQADIRVIRFIFRS